VDKERAGYTYAMRGLCVAFVIGVWLLQGQPPQEGQGIRFGKVDIRYDILVSTRRFKGDTYEVEVRGRRGSPVKVESPEQYFTMRCMQLKATLGPDERGRLVLRTAEATGQVEFVYNRPQPLSKLNGTAQRVRYDDQKRTVTLEGDVSLDGEDEFYLIRWRNNERIVVYLEEELQRVEAKSKERDGVPLGSMVIEPKGRQTP
jgi:hypothetical protein